ncbi:hypothetical protein Tco_0400911 [Tanacetum coccineum]
MVSVCAPKCHSATEFCRSTAMPLTAKTKGALGTVRKLLLWSADAQGHFKRSAKYEDQNRGQPKLVKWQCSSKSVCGINARLKLGSLDAYKWYGLVGKYQAVIVFAEKIVRIPCGNETLIVRSDGSDRGNEARLNIISCTKIQKYMLKGCHVFLAHVTTKETEDKSEGKRLKDVPIVRDFPEVFPDEFLGFPPTRQVEFQIDLIPGAALVA